VNTTAGTGSELTKFAVITDPENQTKTPIVDEIIIPDIAVDDTTLMMDMPKGLTAATGIDAMAHAVEAFVSKERNYIVGCTAMEAIRLVDKYLVMAYNQGDNVEARDGMAYAQYLAGMAFSNGGLGIVHAMAHQLGATYHLPHGVSNAMLMPACIRFNSRRGCDLYGEIGRELKLFHGNFNPEIAGEKFAGYVTRLNKQIGIPGNLKEAGVKPEDFKEMAEKALQDVCMETNPVAPTLEDVVAIYEAAYKENSLR
jgi:alcohol dehydrogenase